MPTDANTAMKTYDIQHDICFEDTNAVGNVYFVNHLKWQGRCRESFLRRFAPDVADRLSEGFVLATTRCACEYHDELFAFDTVSIRMSLAGIVQNRIQLAFEYWRISGDEPRLVARGTQEVACMQREGERVVPAPIPDTLRAALEPYRAAR